MVPALKKMFSRPTSHLLRQTSASIERNIATAIEIDRLVATRSRPSFIERQSSSLAQLALLRWPRLFIVIRALSTNLAFLQLESLSHCYRTNNMQQGLSG